MIDSSARARVDRHIVAAEARCYRAISGGSFEITPDWMRGFSGLQSPIFNIFQPISAAGLSDDILADTAAFFSSKQVLYTVELVHDRFPEGLDFLDQRRYQSLPPQPAMFLRNISGNTDLQLNPAVQVERVRTVPSLTAFCTLLHQVFDFPLSDMIRFYPVGHLGGETKDVIRHYLAFLDEQPVGAGTVICLENVAGIRNVCTVDQYRQRGVATTLLFHMLSDAGQRGCRLSILYSTPQAYKFFNKFGFEIYTQRQWFLPPGIDYQD